MTGTIRTLFTTGTAALVLLAAGCGGSTPSSAAEQARTAVAARRTVEVRAEAAGSVEPIRVLEVKSKASGEVLELFVEVGDEVTRGTLLAEIDPRDVRNGLHQAEADLEVALARHAIAEAQMARTEQLRQAGVLSEQDFERSALEAATSKAGLIRAQTNLELAQERMGDVTIRAPIAGTVLHRDLEVGQIIASASQNISGGTTLLQIADLTQMQIRARVDETDIGRIYAGMPATITVDAYPDRRFEGHVQKIEPQAVVEQNVTMFPLIIQIDNRDGLLKPRMNAEIEIQIARRENVLAIPTAAVVTTREAASTAAIFGIDEAELQAALRGGQNQQGAVPPGQAPAATPAGAARAGQTPGAAPTGAGRGGGQPRAMQQRQPADAASNGGRPGIVFLRSEDGKILPRSVVLGVHDWEYTEVLSGLEEGDAVVLVSVARLQDEQARMLERMSGRGFSMFRTGR